MCTPSLVYSVHSRCSKQSINAFHEGVSRFSIYRNSVPEANNTLREIILGGACITYVWLNYLFPFFFFFSFFSSCQTKDLQALRHLRYCSFVSPVLFFCIKLYFFLYIKCPSNLGRDEWWANGIICSLTLPGSRCSLYLNSRVFSTSFHVPSRGVTFTGPQVVWVSSLIAGLENDY